MKYQPVRFLGRAACSASLALLLLTAASSVAEETQVSTHPIRIAIDARDLPRNLLEAELTIPIEAQNKQASVALWYPKWVPGSHGPGGPIANIAGLWIRSPDGEPLAWKRTPGEVYRVEVKVPKGVGQLHVQVRYITNQPTTNSFGHDCFGANHVGVISPGCLLMYPESIDIDQQRIASELQLPAGWEAATALPAAEALEDSNNLAQSVTRYSSVSLRTFVDSPIMLGRYHRTFDLVDDPKFGPPHTLHVFADSAEAAALNHAVVDKYASMVRQTALLMGSHPFDRFDVLLGVTDSLPKNGLEHLRSTLNILPPQALQSPAALKGWDRLLVPHEYLHAWCGKFRRPVGMVTSDFHTPKDTELLWVYEGLTQYLGELIEARSGLMTADEFRHRLFVELRNAMHQQGRQWRPLVDTAAASHVLRSGSPNWGGLRRSQDYYMEGMLFWLEADARIRRLSNGQRSLDDFCQKFFRSSGRPQAPKAYDRQSIVKQLNSIARFDWDGLIARRVESFQQQFDPELAGLLGYEFKLTSTKPDIPAATFRYGSGIDLLDSIGASISSSGVVKRLLLGTAADRAGLAPKMKIVGVGDYQWSKKRILEAIKQAADRQPIELLVERGERLAPVQIHYHAGLRYWSLVRNKEQEDLLAKILQPKPESETGG